VREAATLVPKRALVYDREQPWAWVVQPGDSTAERRLVTPGYEDAERLEARAGVAPGERLIVVGQNGLKAGGKIRVVVADGEPVAAPLETADAAPPEESGR